LPQICKSTVNDIAVVTTSKAVFAAINLGHLPPFDFNPQCHHHSLPWLSPVSNFLLWSTPTTSLTDFSKYLETCPHHSTIGCYFGSRLAE
jgi:hypothetical protein